MVKKLTAGQKWWKGSQRCGQMNSYVIIHPFHSVPTVNSMLLIHLCVLAWLYGADLVISGGSPALEALITVQSSEKSYSHWGWTAAESRWGALFKQRRAVLPNLMETPSPAPPSAAHVFTWGYLLLKVRDRAASRAGWKWVRGGHKNGKIRPLNEDQEKN